MYYVKYVPTPVGIIIFTNHVLVFLTLYHFLYTSLPGVIFKAPFKLRLTAQSIKFNVYKAKDDIYTHVFRYTWAF